MAFTGFTSDAARFFERLADDNSRAFFDAHRDEYERCIRQPLEDLLAEAEARVGPGKITRPNRDVRFSANKDSYRTDASMWAGDIGSVYLRVDASGLQVGGGLYGPSRDQLSRARTAIDSQPDAAVELRRIVDDLVGFNFEFAGPFLTTAPKGYDRDHPQIGLLRMKNYAALTRMPIDASSARIHTAWRRMRPLNDWLDARVGAARSWP